MARPGTTWHDISFVTWDADTITLTHDGTQSRVSIKSLPEETRIAVFMAQANSARASLESDAAFAEFKRQGVHFFGKWLQISTKYSAVADGKLQWKDEQLPVYVVGAVPADAVDGGKWDGWLWLAGRQRVPDEFGAAHMVTRYATSPELALTLQRADAGN